MDLAFWISTGLGTATAVLGLVLVRFQWGNISAEIERDSGWQVMWHERIMEDETDGRD